MELEATAAIQSEIASKTESVEPSMVMLIFSCIGLAVSLLAMRYGLEVDPSCF
jgi:hypothetical protein